MNSVVVILLGVVWASILVPGLVRLRRGVPVSAIGALDEAHVQADRRKASLVGPSSPATLARRRAVFGALVAAVVVLVPSALLFGGVFNSLALLSTGSLLAYVVVLLQLKARRDALRRKLRWLHVPSGDLPPGAGHAAEALPGSARGGADQRRHA